MRNLENKLTNRIINYSKLIEYGFTKQEHQYLYINKLKVYDYLTTIPKGKVVTYKQIGEYLGNKGLARAVGNILHKNTDGNKYPCYKILNSKGQLAEAFVLEVKLFKNQDLKMMELKLLIIKLI